MIPLQRSLALVLLAAVLVTSACKKKAPVVEDAGGGGTITDPAETMQVVAVTPDAVPAQRAAPAKLYGAGFEEGATVRIGDQDVGAVTFLDANTLGFTMPALPDGVFDVTVRNPDGSERTLRAAVRVGTAAMMGADACRSLVVYFALDEAGLNDAARRALDGNASCYTTSGARVRIEGHADERGTTDYNVALGMRRAESVRMYLVNKGVPPASTGAVSWGEERPSDPGHNEAAWSKNRRVELHLEM